MALILADRVRETSTTTGTGALSLAGAVVGYQTFSSAIGNTNTCYYAISNPGVAEWEVGIGTYATSGNTLTRTTILKSSNANAAVSFSAGTKDVFVTYPATKSVYLDASGNVTLTGTLTANTIGAFTLSGTVAGGGNQLNNVIIGTTTPLAGAFTTLSAKQTSGGTTALTIKSFDASGGNQPLGVFQRSDAAVSIELGYDGTTGNGHVGTTTAHDFEIWRGGSIKATATSTGLAVTGTLSATGNVTLSGASANIAAGTTTTGGSLSNSTTSSYVLVYGATNGTYPDQVQITAGGTSSRFSSTGLAVTGTGTFSSGAVFGTGVSATQTSKVIVDMTSNSGRFLVAGADAGTPPTFNLVLLNNAGGVFAAPLSATSTGVSVTGTLSSTLGATIQGLTVGLGAGAVGNNTALGLNALSGSNSGAGQNVAVGLSAMLTNSSGARNTVVGSQAGYKNTSGSDNIGIGNTALYSNETGASNTAVGSGALAYNTTASSNTAVGYQAGYSNTTGTELSAFGYKAAYSQTTPANSYNTAIGSYSLYQNLTGVQNTTVGWNSLANCTGTGNTAIGYSSGESITSGSKNTVIGRYSGNQGGLDIRTASNYIVLSDGDGNVRGTFDSSGNLGIGDTSPPAPGGADGKVISLKASKFPQYFYKSTDAAANSTTWRTITRDSLQFQIQTLNDAVNTEQTAYEIIRSTGSNNIDYHCWYTTSSERMRLDSSGNLLVGTTDANPAANGVTGVVIGPTGGIRQSSGTGASYFAVTTTSGTHIQFYTYNSGAVAAGLISSSGATTTYAASSDYRLKDIEGPVIGAKDFIMALQPKQGTWKSDGSKFVGFLAHEFQELSPSSVVGEKDAVDADGKPIMQAMQASSSEVMANLISFVQEQQAIITALTTRITALENK